MAAVATRVIGQFVNPPRKPVDAVSTTDRVVLRFVELLQRARLSADKSPRIRLTGRQQGLRLLPTAGRARAARAGVERTSADQIRLRLRAGYTTPPPAGQYAKGNQHYAFFGDQP